MMKSHFNETFSFFEDNTAFVRFCVHRFFGATDDDDGKVPFGFQNVIDALLANIADPKCAEVFPIKWKHMEEFQGQEIRLDTLEFFAKTRGFRREINEGTDADKS